MGRYSNPEIVTRLQAILAGQERDRPPDRTTRSLQHQHRLNTNEQRELLTAYTSGLTIDDLASQFDIHRTTVLAILKRADAPRRAGVIDRNLDEAQRLYEQGRSLAKVGEHFNINAETVRQAFVRAGIPTRPRRGGRIGDVQT